MTCEHPLCDSEALYECECCGTTRFCDSHGTPGGDREGDEDGPSHAVPNRCFRCGGFNADG